MDLKKFVLEGNPVCRKEAVIVGDHFRITMLTTALIRFEYSEDGGFEDRATQMVCNLSLIHISEPTRLVR